MAVGAEVSGWLAELPVEVDGGVEGEDAGCDSGEQAGGGAGEVLFEPQLVFEGLHDRFDPLPDRPNRWVWPVGFVAAAGPQQAGAERFDGLFEPGAGEAFVSEHELAVDRLALEQGERGVPFWGVGGDEVEVTDATVGAAPEHQTHAQNQREWAAE